MRAKRAPFVALAVSVALRLVLPTVILAQSPSAGPSIEPSSPISPYPLVGTPWRLTDYLAFDGPRRVGPKVVATVRLRSGDLRGSGGCGRLAGRATIGDRSLDVELERGEVDPGRACADDALHVQQALVDGLERVATYAIEPGGMPWQAVLVLRDAFDNTLLRFRVDDASDPTASEWRLDAVSRAGVRMRAVADSPAVLTFTPTPTDAPAASVRGELLGSSGCNGIVGRFTLTGSTLDIAALELTDAPCAPSLAAQEAAITSVLRAPDITVELPPGRLVLTSASSGDGVELVTSTPLEGGTWVLARAAGVGALDEPVTLRLVEGVASGEGPCGSYGGRYETNGVLVRLRDLGPVDDACPEARAFRRYLSALRRARFVDQRQPSLRLLDRSARTVARFRDPGGP